MYVWSKRLVISLLAAFLILYALFLAQGLTAATSNLKIHTVFLITLNYVGLVLWLFVWMLDQARVRGKNVWWWLLPFLIVPLPTLMLFVLYMQLRLKA